VIFTRQFFAKSKQIRCLNEASMLIVSTTIVLHSESETGSNVEALRMISFFEFKLLSATRLAHSSAWMYLGSQTSAGIPTWRSVVSPQVSSLFWSNLQLSRLVFEGFFRECQVFTNFVIGFERISTKLHFGRFVPSLSSLQACSAILKSNHSAFSVSPTAAAVSSLFADWASSATRKLYRFGQ
jgi:hypothetical protein